MGVKLTHLVTITGLGGLSLACGGAAPPCGPLASPGNSCIVERQCLIPGEATSCGLNGYECRDGEWRELMTYCNPPPMPAVVDCDTIDPDGACSSGDRCTVAAPEDCGIIGYTCTDGAWQPERETCNPPPSPDDG